MPTLLGANTLSTGYDVANSLRFASGDSSYLDRAASGSTSSNTTFTVSFWTKRAHLGDKQVVFMHENATSHAHKFEINFRTDNKITIETYKDGYEYNVLSSAQFKDVSAWYHFVVRVDTTQSTESDRYRIYANGTQLTLTEAGNGYPSQNFEFNLGTKILAVGRYQAASPSAYLDGHLTEVVYCDGQSLAPTSFGEFDSDSPTIWKPIDVSGLTFGNNGFYLDFEDSSNLGNDVSSNASDFTANNLDATHQSTDTCTNNFCTLNPLYPVNTFSYSEGNLKGTSSGSAKGIAKGTIGIRDSGKWYFEIKGYNSGTWGAGIAAEDSPINTWSLGSGTHAIYNYNGTKHVNASSSSYGATFTGGDYIGVAYNADDAEITFYKNGASQGTITGLTTGIFMFPTIGDTGTSTDPIFECNFGNPTFSISSGNADDNGYGNFEYAPPSGYYSICTKNLAEFG